MHYLPLGNGSSKLARLPTASPYSPSSAITCTLRCCLPLRHQWICASHAVPRRSRYVPLYCHQSHRRWRAVLSTNFFHGIAGYTPFQWLVIKIVMPYRVSTLPVHPTAWACNRRVMYLYILCNTYMYGYMYGIVPVRYTWLLGYCTSLSHLNIVPVQKLCTCTICFCNRFITS